MFWADQSRLRRHRIVCHSWLFGTRRGEPGQQCALDDRYCLSRPIQSIVLAARGRRPRSIHPERRPEIMPLIPQKHRQNAAKYASRCKSALGGASHLANIPRFPASFPRNDRQSIPFRSFTSTPRIPAATALCPLDYCCKTPGIFAIPPGTKTIFRLAMFHVKHSAPWSCQPLTPHHSTLTNYQSRSTTLQLAHRQLHCP
jgi:hypothetical protein